MSNMRKLEAAYLTLHHIKTLISGGALSALYHELEQPQGCEQCVAALHTALALLEQEGVTLDRQEGTFYERITGNQPQRDAGR